MKKTIALLLVVVMVALAGCTAAQTNDTTPAAQADDTAPAVQTADFTVPDGYTLEKGADNTYTITKDGQSIGGIIPTALSPDALKEEGDETIDTYLNSLGGNNKTVEFVTMYFGGTIHANVALTDSGDNSRTEQTHVLFAKDSKCYDLWYNSETVTADDAESLQNAVTGK